MSDCPYCGDWRYDPMAAPVRARPVGNWLPVVWDREGLRVARGSDVPDGRKLSTARHICEAHPLEPDVLLLGPVQIGMH